MQQLFFSLGLIACGLALGYGLRLLDLSGRYRLPLPLDDCRKLLQKVGLLFFMPLSFAGAVWVVSFSDLRVVLLPAVGLFALLTGGVLGLLLARLLRAPGRRAGVLFCRGSFTNIGAIGGLVCYVFLGEAGFALLPLYKMFEEIAYYTIGFPIARFFSETDTTQQKLGRRLFTVLTDPFVVAALSSFTIGLSLNLMQVQRPYLFELITAVSIPAGTFILIVSIGMGMRLSRIGGYLPESLGISLIKFLLVPASTCTLAYALGLRSIQDGLVFKTILILSSMPVAFNALVAASIYDLDLDLANRCWLTTTGALIVIMPILYQLLQLF